MGDEKCTNTVLILSEEFPGIPLRNETHMGELEYAEWCTGNERNGTEWMRARIKELRIKRNNRQRNLSSMFNKRVR
jgi:hypothetical protein